MNSKKHKLPRRILAMLLAICMFVTMFPSAMFAVDDGTGSTGQTTSVSTDSEDLSITKSVSGQGTEDNPYQLTMEAFVSGKVGASSSAPLDIVLVMDQSGSMAYNDRGYSTSYESDRRISSLKTALTSFVDTIQQNAQENDVNHRIAMVGYASNETDGNSTTVRGADVTTGSDDESWVNTGLYINGEMKNYISGITDASYEEVYEEELDSSETYYIIGDRWRYQEVTYDSQRQEWGYYQNRRWHTVLPKESSDDWNWDNKQFYRYNPGSNGTELSVQDYRDGLVSVNENGSVNSSITTAISNMEASGATRTYYGMEMAQNVFKNNSADDDRQRVVVLFTDGETDSNENDVIAQANTLKSQYGATVYCVSFGEDVDKAFLDQVSSDYNASGNRVEWNKYSMSASSRDELNNIFVTIAGELDSIDVGADAVLTDTLSEYFNFPAGMSESLEGVTVQVSEATGNGDEPSWGSAQTLNNAQVTIQGDTINVTGFDYSSNAVAKTDDGWQGKKLILTFPIEVNTSANWTGADYYDTNTFEAGLKVPATGNVYEYVKGGQLNDSPNVLLDNIDANGTDVTVAVYVDGVIQENPDKYVTLSRDSGNDNYTYFQRVANKDGVLTYDFNYYAGSTGSDCVDIEVALTEAASEYVLQGVTSYQSYGKSGTSNVKDNSEVGDPKRNTYTVDNVTASDEDNAIDCQIYLRSKYSVQYTQNGESIDGYTDNAVYISQEDVDKTTSPGQYPTEDTSTQMTWKNDESYEKSIDLKDLPIAQTGYTVDGWFVGNHEYDPADYDAENKLPVSTALTDVTGKTIVFNATTTENAPEEPDEEKLIADLDSIVKVDCVNTNYNDGNGHAVGGPYALIAVSISDISEVALINDVYTVTFKVSPVDGYVNAYNSDAVSGNKTHTMQSKDPVNVTATYDKDQNKWTTSQEIKFDVKCDDPLDISSIEKNVITADQKEKLPQDVKDKLDSDPTIQYPNAEEGKDPVLTVEKGTNVTLLYAIKVTGTPNTEFKVQDIGADLVGADTGITEDNDFFCGTTDANGEKTFYVKRTFKNITESGPQTNTATAFLKDQNPSDIENPPKDEANVDVGVIPDPEEDIKDILPENLVTIKCTDNGTSHETTEKTYSLKDDSYTVTYTGGTTATVTITATEYIEAFNTDVASTGEMISHELNGSSETQNISLEYKNGEWKTTTATPIVFNVKCAAPDEISAITKTVQTSLPTGLTVPEGVTFVYPETVDGSVEVKEGSDATLLYAITVTGTPNIGFKVVDEGATLISGQDGMSQSDGVIEGTLDANGTKTFYLYKTFENISLDSEPLKNTIAAFLEDQNSEEDTPEATDEEEVPVDVVPQAPDVVKLLGDAAVEVDCVNPNVGHGDKDPATYGLLNGTYELKPSEDGLHYTVTITNALAYVDKYNETLKGHELVAGPEGKISLNYKGDGNWEISGALLIEVTCPKVHSVDTFEKSVVTRAEAEKAAILNESNQDTYTFPDDEGKVTVTEGDDATLLYKITVKGTPGTSVTVTDDGTTFVKAVGLANIGPNSPYEFKLPDTGEATLYVSKTFTNIQKDEQAQDQQTLDNTATIVNNDNEDKIPDDGKTEENVPVDVEPVSAFVKTVITTGDIDTLPEDLKTRTDVVFPTRNEDGSIEQVVVPQGGSVTLLYAIKVEGGDGDTFTVKDTGADLVYAGASDVTEDTANDTFSGTIDKSGSVQFYVIRTFSSDDVKDQKLTNSATLTSEDIDLEPGEEEQEEEVPATTEDLQVVVTPADVTSYEGGDGGYDGVVDEDNSKVEGENSPSLPHPMFYIDAPEGVDPAGLTFVNGDKVWTVKEDGLDGDETNPRMLYHFVEGAEQEPVRVTYTYVNHETQEETTVTSDNLDKLKNVADVYTYLRIDLYAGENDLSDVKASINGTSYAIKAESGQLTVRAVEADNPSDVTSDIQANAPVEDGTADTAVAVEPANTIYTLNDTEVKLPEDSNPSLLFDNIIDDSVNRTAALEAKADQKLNADADDYNYEIMYLDLVDTNNGNAWITSSEGTDIYWDYPEGTDRNTDFEILHFTGLHREDSETTDSGFEIEDLESISMDEIENVTIKEKTDDYIVFHVTEANFSPYAIAWEADHGGSDNPGWTPGGSGDEPDGLNTEDHFSYIVGYAEDYRTGEPTDNEDLWPVKPNNQITRAEVATIFYRLLEDEVRDEYDTTVNDFSDVSADSWYNQTVSTLASMEIVKGYEDGSFRPNAPITRAEFGAIATRFFAETGATYVPGTFTDVTGDEWYANAIQDAVNLGLIGGYPDGTVRPNNNITRAEACAIVNRTLGRVPDADHLLPEDVMKVWPDNNPTDWFYADMQEATNGHEYAWIEEDGHEIEEWTNLLDKDWTDR